MNRTAAGKLAYGALFVVGVPTLMVWWAVATADVVPLPAVHWPLTGWALAFLGMSLLLSAMATLVLKGNGLPMNMYPPASYVTGGVYRYLANPIYLGFGMVAFGASLALGSASGLWLVSPAVALAMAALVMGYESHDLKQRFGEDVIKRPILELPGLSSEPPTRWHRAAVFFLVFLPWTVAFEAVYRLGIPADAVEAYLPFERNWPVLEWTELVYASVYLFVVLVPLVLRTQESLRRFALTGLVATVVVTLIYLTVPVVAPPRPFVEESFLGRMLAWERAMSHTVAAFPSFHVIWTLIAAEGWSRWSRKAGVVAWIWATLIAVSCVTTGMHALIDILFAGIVYSVVRRYDTIWGWMLRLSQAVANSWREWRFGPVRFINHGAYAVLGGLVGCTIFGAVAREAATWQILAVHAGGLIGAGLWAQKLEGSPALSRPFGYYGAVIGAIAVAVAVGLVEGNAMLLLAALAAEGPWLQAIGRLRCLVQGCCHGSPVKNAENGIRYWMPRSRVVELGNLEGVPLHPTPLYSILANVVLGVLVLRLWSLGAAYGVILGAYMMLSGLSRFVEESFRGEPQTPVLAGLRIYQWAAIASFALGIVATTLPAVSPPRLDPWFEWPRVVVALGFGILCGFALGVDFPALNRRFARLASS